MLGAVTLISYLFIYTPLKRVTWLNTAVGAIPGGAAADDGLGGGARRVQRRRAGRCLRFWRSGNCRISWPSHGFTVTNTRKAGFKMLPVVDADGHRTGRQAVATCGALLPVELVPVFVSSGRVVLSGRRAGAGAAYLWFADRSLRGNCTREPRGAAIIFRVHPVSAAAAGGDGVGQGEVKIDEESDHAGNH